MKKTLSVRELILIGILIVLVAYYFIVQGPVAEETSRLESELADLNALVSASETMAISEMSMKNTIDELMDKYDGKPPMTPEYNNENRILAELNTILGDTVEYNITFDNEMIDETNPHIVRRPISITFITRSYKDAVSKIEAINSSDNGYLIGNVTIKESKTGYGYFALALNTSEKADNYSYSVNIDLTEFEYVKN